jgi:hypothetical protein
MEHDQRNESTPAKPEPVKAWGVLNYAGSLMWRAFQSKHEAEADRAMRWPLDPGMSRVIPVTITPDGE